MQHTIFAHDPSLAAIRFVVIHWGSAIRSTMGIIVLIWSTFCDVSCCSVGSLQVIVTDLHNGRLPLILHRSPIIHPVTYRPS
jgi:hypothetical protein